MTQKITEKQLENTLVDIIDFSEEPPLIDSAFFGALSDLRTIHRILDEKYNAGKELLTKNEVEQNQNDIEEMGRLIMSIDAKLTLFRKKL